jgi:Predicted transcriptional regulator
MTRKPEIIIPASETVHDDYLVCMFDGAKRKMLQRYVMSLYGMTWEEYKAYCKLPSDYPAVAPGYARSKSVYAAKVGLGSGPSENVTIEIPRNLADMIAPLALNESMSRSEFVAHILIEHLLEAGKPDKD